MTIKTLRQGMELMGTTLSLSADKQTMTVGCKGVKVSIPLEISVEELESAWSYIGLNIKNFCELVRESVSSDSLVKAQKGGEV